jgi:excisionase family DNA binding protein
LKTFDNEKGYDTMSTVDNHTKKILTVQEVADTLRVHRTTIYRLAKSGELKSYVIGKRRLFKEEDVWAFFENRVAHECVLGNGGVKWPQS